jgi:hypothetical protein
MVDAVGATSQYDDAAVVDRRSAEDGQPRSSRLAVATTRCSSEGRLFYSYSCIRRVNTLQKSLNESGCRCCSEQAFAASMFGIIVPH